MDAQARFSSIDDQRFAPRAADHRRPATSRGIFTDEHRLAARPRTPTTGSSTIKATGQLFFDADGRGAGAQMLIEAMTGAPTLAASDFVVI